MHPTDIAGSPMSNRNYAKPFNQSTNFNNEGIRGWIRYWNFRLLREGS